MSYKTILVHCDAGPRVERRLHLAVHLAERNSAHLIGLHTRPPFLPPGLFEAGAPLDALYASYEAAMAADAATSRAAYDAALTGRALSHDWLIIEGPIDRSIALRARSSDLLVLGQSDPTGESSVPTDLPEVSALSTGRPCLIVPHNGTVKPPGTNIMLCWNASRESARAAADALPFLRNAEKVTVLVVDPRSSSASHGPEPGADVATWLAHHGVAVTVQREAAADGDVGGIILSRTADLDIDLIVMGVYGHSRVREMILGGASRSLLADMTVPILMSH